MAKQSLQRLSSAFQFGRILLLGFVLVLVVITVPGGIMQLLGAIKNRSINRPNGDS